MDLNVIFSKNMDYFGSKDSNFEKYLREESKTLSFLQLATMGSSVSEEYEIRDGETIIFNSLFLQCASAFDQQYKKPRRVFTEKIVGLSPDKQVDTILQQIVGSEELISLNSLPCFRHDEGNDNSPLLASSIVLLGGCSLLYLDKLLALDWPKTFLLVESDLRQLCIALHFVDIETVIDRCKQKKISFEILISQSFSGDPQRFPIILQKMANKQPRSVIGFNIFRSPRLSPDMIQVESWMASPDGLMELVKGYLGNDTDEFNQVLHALHNSITNPVGKIMPEDLDTLPDPAILVASGPSLDESIKVLSSWKLRPLIVAAGSSIGALLRNNISPDILVLLEQSGIVYHDLVELISEGFDLSGILLFGSATLDPRVFSLFKNTCIFHRPLSSSLLLFPDEEFAILPQAGPQAANAGLEVLMKLGFRNLLLLGCDFGAVDESYQRSISAMGTSPRTLSLPFRGSKGRTVYSSPELSVTRQLFEHIITLYGANVCSLGEGSRINNVVGISYSEAVSRFSVQESFSSDMFLDLLLSKMKTRQVCNSDLSRIFEESSEYCRRMTLEFSVSLDSDLSGELFYEKVFPFISWEYRSNCSGIDLYHRLTKFLYFFILQSVLSQSSSSDSGRYSAVILSLDKVQDIYLAYFAYCQAIVGTSTPPAWDLRSVRESLVKEWNALNPGTKHGK